MSKEDAIKSQTVKINQGSGFIVQPATKDFSYIFTAKHNLQNDTNKPSDGLLEKSEIIIQRPCNESSVEQKKIEALELYVSDTIDIAIIKVPYQSDVLIYPSYEKIEIGETVRLWGFPTYDENKNEPLDDQINALELKIHRNDGNEIELRNKSDATYNDVIGYSGGGVFSLSSTSPSLVSIQSKMSHGEAEHNHIKSIPVKFFKELIENKNLKNVYPYHLNNYSSTAKDTFIFENCVNPKNLNKAKNRLQSLAEKYVSAGICSPLDIINSLRSHLKVHNRKTSELENKKLWIALLEIIVIKHLIDSVKDETKWTVSDVKYLFNSVRFIFINSTKSWKRHLEEIICTNLDHLNDDGIALLVLIGEQDLPEDPVLDPEIFRNAEPDISNGLDGSAELIDLAENSPICSGDIKIIHFAKLHSKCLVADEFKLKNLNSNDALQHITQNYSKYIPQVDQIDE
ncbi:ABC-three component system protein [Microbulbifer sp. TRSA002]|uniref:ABC-three component system protein n=1 Tax=Microbulbifer sp. TRSA002 TaxID=3243382 RepID=UPI0040391EE6